MNESSSLPDFGGRAVLPLGQENFQPHGSGCIILAIEDLSSPDLPIAVAEVAAIFRHHQAHRLRLGKQERTFIVAAIFGTYT
jgi:hypothetical protein